MFYPMQKMTFFALGKTRDSSNTINIDCTCVTAAGFAAVIAAEGFARDLFLLLLDLLGGMREDLRAAKTLPLLALLFCRACRTALSTSSQRNCWWTCARIWL